MEGLIRNNGSPVFIFKRKFFTGHTVELSALWDMYEKKVKASGVKLSTEADFVKWLDNNHYMLPQFTYIPGESKEISLSVHEELDVKDDCDSDVSEKPSLANAPSKVIQSLTYKDIAALRLVDDPSKLVASITSVSKLRRAYSMVRNMSKKRRLEKILRERIQELERL